MFSRTLVALPLLLACDPGREPPDNNKPPPPLTIEKSSALTAANQNLRAHLVGAGQAGFVADDHQLLSDLISIGGGDAPIACEPGTNCPEPTPDTLESDAAEMADDISARILHVANVLVEEPTRIVLRLKPEQACTQVQTTDPNGNITSMPDAGCVQALTLVPVEIEISSRREGDIDLVLTIGPHAVGKIEAYRAKIAAELDIGATMDAAEALATASGEPMEEVTGTIRGRVRAEIIQNSARDYTFQISIVSPIDIDATIGGETLMVDIGTSIPLASLRLDGNAPKIVVESNVGRIEITIPLGAFSSGDVACPPPPQGQPPEPCTQTGLSLDGVLGISVGETHAKMTFDTTNEVKAEYGLKGGAQVQYNGLPLLSYLVNPNNGEAFDARYVSEENGFLLAVSPLLDLRATFNLRNLGEDLDADTPDALLEDTLQLLLNGAAEPAVRYRTYSIVETTPEGNQITTEKTALEVVSGRMTLSSAAAGTQVVVEAGMCLDSIEADPNQPSPHPFELLTSAVCE